MSTLELDDFLITGRTYGEYCAFFNLDPIALKGKRVLDCPGGASSFVYRAKKEGILAQAADVIYRFPLEGLKARGEASIEIIYQDPTWMQGHDFTFYESIPNHRRFREKALKEFLHDYNRHDYRFATLPHLPYADGAFDLVLSSHLLFVYDDRLDEAFHIQSIREMLRIGQEVRLFPLVDFKNSREQEEQNFSPLVERVIEALQGEYTVAIEAVGFQFQRGAGYMLSVKHKT